MVEETTTCQAGCRSRKAATTWREKMDLADADAVEPNRRVRRVTGRLGRADELSPEVLAIAAGSEGTENQPRGKERQGCGVQDVEQHAAIASDA